VRRSGWIAGVLLTTKVLVAPGAEAPPAKQQSKNTPDIEFLEYLGTLEGDGENWTDIVKADLMHTAKPKSGAKKNPPKTETAAKSASSEK
jgi:hypothetical protein